MRFPVKFKLTLLRKHIFDIIKSSDIPLNAKNISDRMKLHSNLSTIYRALDYMEKEKLIVSVALFDGTRFYCSGDRHSHFILCKECHEIKEFDKCSAGDMVKSLEKEYNYRITEHVFYFIGVCGDCEKVLNKKAIYS
jgi:Fur family transcriptional regulator, ferric uptake regulator